MNIQIFIILILALILFGPKQMIQYAYVAGRYLAKFRAMWEQTAQVIQKEFEQAGLDLPPGVLTGKFDIGAEAMRVINGTPAESPNVPSMQPPDSMINHAVISTTPVEPIVVPVLASPTETPTVEPSLNPPADDDQADAGKKYDAWLPS